MNEADAADDEALVAARHPATAGIRCVIGDGVRDVVQSDSVTQQLGGIEVKPELTRQPSKVVHAGNAGNLTQCRLDYPSLIFGQFYQVLDVGFDRVPIDLQFRRGDVVESGRSAAWQRNVTDTFPDALADKIVFGAVFKQHIDLRQSERTDRSHADEAGRAVECPLQRDGNLLFALLG